MSVLEFETMLEDGIIRLPAGIAAQVSSGTPVRVSITPLIQPWTELNPDEAWNSILAFIRDRVDKGSLSTPYTWRRDDAYDHLA